MRLSIRALSGLRVTLIVLLLAGIGAFGVAYALFVSHQTRYLESRNFRLLQSLAVQTQGAIGSEVRRFESQVREFRADTWKYLRERRYAGADLPDTLTQIEQPTLQYRLASRDGGYFVDLKLSAAARGTAVRRPHPTVQQLWLPLASILEPVFRPKVRQSAFDTVALATEEGEVWFATGGRAEELKSSRLDALVVQPAKAAPRKLAELLNTTVIDLTIGGVDYRLFAQPCCRLAGNEKTMVVVGLVEASSLRATSRAIPTTLVKLAVLAVLTMLVLWPFLKFALLGGRQRVRTLDVFQIGVSSITALGLLTITILDTYAYRRLGQQQDHDLARLATAIEQSFTAEMAAASNQLACLEDVTQHFEPDPTGKLQKGHAVADLLGKDIRYVAPAKCEATLNEKRELRDTPDATPPSAKWPHPFFDSFSLIARNGMQDVKLATTGWVTSRIQVKDRRYVRDVQNKVLWQDSRFCPNDRGCVLESVLSWTTGEPEAVLSTVAANKKYLAAALSLPLRSLTQPVLPPGFEFAVIDGTGGVVFHSDSQRNGFENFFKESDDNRRLRAQVLAHSTEPLDLRYWGAPYRAYVRPLAPFGLSVVTLLQKERTWALNREWLVVSLLFFAGYVALCGVALLITLASGPSWVWPDPARARRYPLVIGLNAVLLLLAVVAAARSQGTSLVWYAYSIPLAAWIGTFALLRARPALPAAAGGSEPVRAHRAMLVLLLVVSGVVPGALLFGASFQLHIHSYLKHTHFRLARALVQREERIRFQYASTRGAKRDALLARIQSSRATDRYHDLYHDFFHRTCLSEGRSPLSGVSHCVPGASLVRRESEPSDEPGGDDQVLGFLESYLPYYSELSIEWRELLHDRAGDRSWHARTGSNGVLSTTLPAAAGETITLASVVPRLFGSDEPDASASPGEGAIESRVASVPRSTVWLGMSGTYFPVLVFALLLAAVARQLVVFITKHVFLTGITEPLWSSLKLTAHTGDNLLVLCDAEMKARQSAGAQPLRLGAIAREADMASALRRELVRIGRTHASGTVLVDDLDEDVDDAALMRLKVTLLERLAADRARVVVVLSQLSPMALADSVRPSRRVKRGEATPDRWQDLMSAFVLIDWRATVDQTGATPSEPKDDSEAAPAPEVAVDGITEFTTRAVRELLKTEGRGHPLVERICMRIAASEAVQRGNLSRDQVLEEIAEQAAPCYRRLWSSCSDDEKVVLVHIAQDGLTHAGARPVVRRLLARKLLRKGPELALMNRSFQFFVLSPVCCAEVSRLEASTGPSVWDNLRVPLGVTVVGAALFLIATQRELYEAILGATTAAAVSVPTLVRAVGMLAGRRHATDGKLA